MDQMEQVDQVVEKPKLVAYEPPGAQKAWQMVAGQLQLEMKPANYAAWIKPLKAVSFREGVFHLAAVNPFTKKWVQEYASKTIERLLEGIYNQTVSLSVSVAGQVGDEQTQAQERAGAAEPDEVDEAARQNNSKAPRGAKEETPMGSKRKISLQRYYGNERARVVQPDRYLPVTRYFFLHWFPLLGHSAAATVIAARSLCFWNVETGEMRNVIETDMSTLAKQASVSLRTVKDVLNNELVQRYFLRYKVRRIVTQYGVRTAGIILQVRMDDPLTPEDQVTHQLPEEERWYSADFEDEEDD